MVQRLKCPKCSTLVTVTPGEAPKCSSCGFSGPAPTGRKSVPIQATPTPPAPTSAAPAKPPADPFVSPAAIDMRPPLTAQTAVLALVANIFVPGAGSILAGRKTEGIWQLVMLVGALLLWIVFVGKVILAAGWVWGIVTGIQVLQQTSKQPVSL